jgi:hypothetical protein
MTAASSSGRRGDAVVRRWLVEQVSPLRGSQNLSACDELLPAVAPDGNDQSDVSISWLAVRLTLTNRLAIRRTQMKYVMLIYQGTALERQAALPENEQKQVYADYQGINQTPGVTPGLPMGLPENATTVRVDGGKTLTTDGPFVGMKEAVGGWFIFEADDLDAAIEVAARVPAARYGGAVEIRPSEVYW